MCSFLEAIRRQNKLNASVFELELQFYIRIFLQKSRIMLGVHTERLNCEIQKNKIITGRLRTIDYGLHWNEAPKRFVAAFWYESVFKFRDLQVLSQKKLIFLETAVKSLAVFTGSNRGEKDCIWQAIAFAVVLKVFHFNLDLIGVIIFWLMHMTSP